MLNKFREDVKKDFDKFTHVVFNRTTGGAVSKHKDADSAELEADNLRRYHGNDVFQVKSLDDAQKEFDETGDVHAVTAVGDGTQHQRFQPDALVNETPKDRVQVATDKANEVVAKEHNPAERTSYDKNKPEEKKD